MTSSPFSSFLLLLLSPFPPSHPQAIRAVALVHRDAELPQLDLGELDLAHDLGVRGGDVVEGEHAPAEAGEEVCPEGDEGPERELFSRVGGKAIRLVTNQPAGGTFVCSLICLFKVGGG